MTNKLTFCFSVSLTAMLLCGCGSDSTAPDTAAIDAVDGGQVTFLVEGMTERLSIY